MKYYFMLILLFLFSNMSAGQDSCKTSETELKHGLQFQITDLLTLTNYDGYTVSYRHLINSSLGIRVGFITNVLDATDDVNELSNSNNSDQEYIRYDYNFKFSTQLISHLLSHDKFALIIGGGPFISYQESESSSEYPIGEYERTYKNKNKGIGYGIDIILGVEYELSRNVILSSEYGLTISNTNQESERIDNQIYEDPSLNNISEMQIERNLFRINGMGVNLGISVFF